MPGPVYAGVVPQTLTEIIMKIHTLALVLLASATFAACSSIESRPAMVSNGMLTGSNGMTLYTFDKDVAGSGKSVCNGPCASNWPPQFAADSDRPGGDYSIIVRDDGKKQWALKGKPLYYWAKDQNPGDKTGDGFNNVWHVAKP
jgi:predicted lipoprotein with Yx(FWY)xxD motif